MPHSVGRKSFKYLLFFPIKNLICKNLAKMSAGGNVYSKCNCTVRMPLGY